MIPTISQVCSLHSPLEQDIEDYAAGKCPSLEIWLTKLEEYLKTHSVPDFARLLKKHHMQAPVASFQGGLLASQGERRKEAWNLFAERLELCAKAKIATIVVACDVPAPLEQKTLERVQHSLQQLGQEVEKHGIKAAVEFQANSAFGNNLQTAAALIGEAGSPSVGLCLDVFHWYVGPSKFEDLGYLSAANLFHVQVSDLADIPRELARDSDRILPGDGDLPLAPLVEHLKNIGYQGCVSLELMNPQLWQVPPLQMGEIGMTALRKLLGLAGAA